MSIIFWERTSSNPLKAAGVAVIVGKLQQARVGNKPKSVLVQWFSIKSQMIKPFSNFFTIIHSGLGALTHALKETETVQKQNWVQFNLFTFM